MKKLLCIVISAIMTLCLFCSCKSEEEEIDLQYEVPVDTLFESLDSQDSNSFLRCFAAPVLSVYEKSEEYDENIAKTVYDSFCETCKSDGVVVNSKITDKRELSKEEIEALGDGVKPRHKIKKAFEIKVRVMAFSHADKNVTYSQEITLVVGKLSGHWYICQSPIIEWHLIKDVKA